MQWLLIWRIPSHRHAVAHFHREVNEGWVTHGFSVYRIYCYATKYAILPKNVEILENWTPVLDTGETLMSSFGKSVQKPASYNESSIKTKTLLWIRFSVSTLNEGGLSKSR